jgi:hypothetical protein
VLGVFCGTNLEDGALIYARRKLRHADLIQNNITLRRNWIWNPRSQVVKSALKEQFYITSCP